MNEIFSPQGYEEMLARLFVRFPSFQKVGAGAYKPGIANVEFADQLMGHPHRQYDIIHVAGTNGKGSVSNMLSSVLAATGKRVGLYNSPHILDFRERMRVVADGTEMVSKEYVWDFVHKWQDTFDHLDMSFFEITTVMSLCWFADMGVDVVVLETGLGGRLDSTNIVTPVLSVITNIGLDHCDMLGETLPEIAFEKAGIIKPLVPVVVGESHPETDPVFERKVLYTNLSEPSFMGDRKAVMSLLSFADKTEPGLWDRHEEILAGMDLRGDYQRKNLRTVLAALDVLAGVKSRSGSPLYSAGNLEMVTDALMHTAGRTGFCGRWETMSEDPWVICDIGHNEHGLRYNFAQLEDMLGSGECTGLVIVYGSVADKDVGAAIRLMPERAVYVFTNASGKRAMPAEAVRERYLDFCRETGREPGEVHCCPKVSDAVAKAFALAASLRETAPDARPLIYIGGSTYVVSEAQAYLKLK
ncbi:MAG: bifunctional folylpolyglutamate synthase/dihydrofolate synthase [Bacteroidales bacterium]|nr:bifunctional folylpolyglutamate synthase/dihydrofolate synthase [Bacteroidales bacterium]